MARPFSNLLYARQLCVISQFSCIAVPYRLDRLSRIDPIERARDGFLPLPVKFRSFFLREIRLPGSVDGPVRAQFIESREKVHGQARSVSRTERRRLLNHRTHDL